MFGEPEIEKHDRTHRGDEEGDGLDNIPGKLPISHPKEGGERSDWDEGSKPDLGVGSFVCQRIQKLLGVAQKPEFTLEAGRWRRFDKLGEQNSAKSMLFWGGGLGECAVATAVRGSTWMNSRMVAIMEGARKVLSVWCLMLSV